MNGVASELLTIPEAAKHVGLTTREITDLIIEGAITPHRVEELGHAGQPTQRIRVDATQVTAAARSRR
jgi:hypothetical protein